MRNYSLFLKNKNRKSFGKGADVKSETGTTTVAMFSDFFSDVSDDLFCTNAMYSDFKDAVISSIEVYSPRENIVLNIYETKESDEDKRAVLQIGFSKYIHACYQKVRHECMQELLQVSFFMVVGILLVILGYKLESVVPNWMMYCITNFGTVLIWQFVGFWAFEFNGQKREWDRLAQIEEIQYEYRKWE